MQADDGKTQQAKTRSARLSAALRENLKRRKAQTRGRTSDDGRTTDDGPGGGGTGRDPDFRRNRGPD